MAWWAHCCTRKLYITFPLLIKLACAIILVIKRRWSDCFETTFSTLRNATIFSLFEFIPIVAKEDIITVNSLLHLSISHSFVKLILMIHISTRAELTCIRILLILAYKGLALECILMELRSRMSTPYLLWTYLGELLWIVSLKWSWISL